MAIVVKVIKPKKLNIAAFRLEALNEMRVVAKGMKAEFKKTVETWEHKPDFDSIISLTAPGPAVFVGPTGDDEAAEIYRYVDEGTRPHEIRPKKAGGRLVFQWGGPGSYRPKSRVNTIGSTSGGSTGPVVAFKAVHHPGTKARNFDKIIAKKWLKPFKTHMERALARAAAKSGHGVKQ